MAVVIGVPASAEGETRSPVVGDVVKKLAALGASVLVERGATDAAFATAESLGEVTWAGSTAEVLASADVIWTINGLDPAAEAHLRPGQVLMGLLHPYASAEHATRLADAGVTAFAMELLPRISRAQSMDILSSQGAASGYQCVLIAAARAPKFFPMLTYAAGTIRPSRVLVIGAGVAGLQAIATAKRLGAKVSAYDVRPASADEVRSMGATFIKLELEVLEGAGGYAREMTEERAQQQRDLLTPHIAAADVLITTAAVPGRRAPLLVTRPMVETMRPGSVVVDLASETGGNVEGSVAGEEIRFGEVLVWGGKDVASEMPVHASQLYAMNVLNLLALAVKDGQVLVDIEDEVLAGCAVVLDGDVRNEAARDALQGGE